MRALVAVLIVASGVGFALWFTKRQSKARETRAIARAEPKKQTDLREQYRTALAEIDEHGIDVRIQRGQLPVDFWHLNPWIAAAAGKILLAQQTPVTAPSAAVLRSQYRAALSEIDERGIDVRIQRGQLPADFWRLNPWLARAAGKIV